MKHSYNFLKSIGNPFFPEEANDIILLPGCFNVAMVSTTIANTLAHNLKLYSSGLIHNKIKICIVINEYEKDKHKEEDKETNLERLVFLCNEFESNGLDIHYSIFSVNQINYVAHEQCNSMWYFKKQWVGDKNQIMVKKSSPGGYSQFEFRTRNINLDFVYEYAEEKNLEIVEFDYSNKFDWILNEMIHSKFIVSEFGGLPILGTFAKCPVFIVTEGLISVVVGGKRRVVTYGNGNLSTSSIIDHINQGLIEQKPYGGFPKCITPKDKNELYSV